MGKSISRREFLKGTAAGALGLATMGIVGCSTSASTGDTAESTTQAPSTTAATTTAVEESQEIGRAHV